MLFQARTLAAAAAFAFVAPAALAQGQPTTPKVLTLDVVQMPRGDKDPANAALLYYKVWLDPVFKELKDPCGEQFNSSDPAWKPDAPLVKLLREHQGYIAMMLRATQAPECDFGIEWSQGIATLLPHLGYMRGSARILGCDARRCVMDGRYDDAAERIAAMYRMAGHVSNDGLLISGLVSAAICNLADAQVYSQMSLAAITVTGKTLMLEEARKMARPDAFGIKHGIAGERRWSCDWLRGFATGPQAGKIIAERIMPLSPGDPDDALRQNIARLTETQVSDDLDQSRKFYDDVLEAWDKDDAKERLKVIETRLESGDYGLVAKVMTPALGKAFFSDTKTRADHAALIQKLDGFIALSR